MINCNEATETILDKNGDLPKYAWPGGYPIYYLDSDNNVLCQPCANNGEDYEAPIVNHDVNWEDNDLTCDDCNKSIEVAYPED